MELSGRTVGDQGRYVVEQRLGSGAMGEVFTALDQRLRKRVVLKVMKPDWSSNPRVRERFRNEALIQANLEHPNVVRALDLVEEPNLLAIVMEFVDGDSLEQYLSRAGGPLPLDEVLSVLVPVMKAIEFAHSKGVVHRDLKPGNILLDQSIGEVAPRVADFGIAKLLDQAGSGMTREGAVLGTPTYMSPEQLKGLVDLDARTDVYALGVILHQMLSGQTPHSGASEYEAVHRVLGGERLPTICGRVDGLPRALDDVIARATEPDREQRYPSVAAFRDALSRATQTDSSSESAIATLSRNHGPRGSSPGEDAPLARTGATNKRRNPPSAVVALPRPIGTRWTQRTVVWASLVVAFVMIPTLAELVNRNSFYRDRSTCEWSEQRDDREAWEWYVERHPTGDCASYAARRLRELTGNEPEGIGTVEVGVVRIASLLMLHSYSSWSTWHILGYVLGLLAVAVMAKKSISHVYLNKHILPFCLFMNGYIVALASIGSHLPGDHGLFSYFSLMIDDLMHSMNLFAVLGVLLLVKMYAGASHLHEGQEREIAWDKVTISFGLAVWASCLATHWLALEWGRNSDLWWRLFNGVINPGSAIITLYALERRNGQLRHRK